MTVRIPKGVFDVLPLPEGAKEGWREVSLWQHVERAMHEVAQLYSFGEIRTPIFERAELFQRGVGQSSDIVSKEMYLFEDKAKRLMALRPEGTAPVVRAYMDNHLQGFAKLYYVGPMFRYERQQAGRYRQHHQFGAEIVGSEAAESDAELIDLLWTLLKRLGIENLTLHLNTLGDTEARVQFRAALKAYLKPHLGDLSADSQTRFEVNPLRILDSKDSRDQAILEGAPTLMEFVTGEARTHFEEVQKLLGDLGIPYLLNDKLVRGLDYYNRTVFEITTELLGAHNSLGGGGRYDELFKIMEGPDLPALGFGAGIERIIQTLLAQGADLPGKAHPKLLLIPLDEGAPDQPARARSFAIAKELREAGLATEVDYSGRKLKGAIKRADQMGAEYVAVIGEEELAKGACEVKEMATRTSREMKFEELKDV